MGYCPGDLDSCAAQLLGQRADKSILLAGETGLQLGNQVVESDLNTLLLRVSLGETHLLDAALASGKLFLAENDSEGNVALFRGLELLGKLGLQLVRELSLDMC